MDIDDRDVDLWDAIEFDKPTKLRRLLASGLAPTYHLTDGWSPLHHAIDCESDSHNQVGEPLDLRLIAPLLAAGADVHARWEPSGRAAKTPLDIAVGFNNRAAIDAIEKVSVDWEKPIGHNCRSVRVRASPVGVWRPSGRLPIRRSAMQER